MTHYLNDLSIYRIPESIYTSKMKAAFNESMLSSYGDEFSNNPFDFEPLPSHIEARKLQHIRGFGGMWKFNEVIGFIRIGLEIDRVVARHWSVNRKVIRKSRQKTFELISWGFVYDVPIDLTLGDEGIASAILKSVELCENKLAPRILDSCQFKELVPFVKWSALRQENAKSR
jgi:hypothetical protein